MKKCLLNIAAMVLVFSGFALARELTIDPTDSGSISVSTNAVSPTLILTNNPAALRTYILNMSTNNIYLGGLPSTVISTSTPAAFSISTSSGNFYIAGATAPFAGAPLIPTFFSPDGPGDSYTGPLWAVSSGTCVSGAACIIQRVRFK